MAVNSAISGHPQHWALRTLREICDQGGGDIQTGPFGSQLHAADYVDQGVPSIMPKNISVEGISTDDIAKITEKDATRLSKYRVRVGDIVYSRRGDVEKCTLVKKAEDGWLCGTGCLRIRLGKEAKISPVFLHAYLSHPTIRMWIVRHAVGATMPNLNTSILNALPVLIPSSDEMRVIEDIWTYTIEKVVLNRQTNQTLEQIAQAIFKSWFVDFEPIKAKQHIRTLGGNDEQSERAAQAVIAGAVNLDVITTATDLGTLDQQLAQALGEKLAHQTKVQREQLASTASHFPDQLVESELGLIPEGWVVSPFSEIAANIRDSVDPTTIDSKILYVGLEHIEKQQMYLANWGHAGDVDSNKLRFTRGDFLFGKLRPYFHKVCRPPIEGICSTDILVNRAVHEDWQGLVQCQLFDPVYVEYANVRSTGTRMPRANWRDMGAYVFVKPNIEIARVFTGFVGGFNQLAARNTWSCGSLIAIRDLLLPKLLSGELVPDQLHRTHG